MYDNNTSKQQLTVNTMDFKRARSEEQRQLRITQFLDTAAMLYEEEGYDKVSLTQISKVINFHRNNVYNYFNCKEDLFLTLILRDLSEAIEDGIATFSRDMKLGEFSLAFTQLLMRHLRLLDLASITNTAIMGFASPNIQKRFRVQVKAIQDKLLIRLQGGIFKNVGVSELQILFYKINIYTLQLYIRSVQYKERHRIPVFNDVGYAPINFELAATAYIDGLIADLKNKKC